MSYVSQPPGYDPRLYPNGEPPGYLDTSQQQQQHREFPHDSERSGYMFDDRGYPLDDRPGFPSESRGYSGDQDFRTTDHSGFLAEFPERGGQGYETSRDDAAGYDLQSSVIPGREFRDDGYSRRTMDPAGSMHMHAANDYATDSASFSRHANDFADSRPIHFVSIDIQLHCM